MTRIGALANLANQYGLSMTIKNQPDGYVIRLETMESESTITVECNQIFAFIIKSDIMDDVLTFVHFYQDILPLYVD